MAAGEGMCAGLKAVDLKASEGVFMEYDTVAPADRECTNLYNYHDFPYCSHFYSIDIQLLPKSLPTLISCVAVV